MICLSRLLSATVHNASRILAIVEAFLCLSVCPLQARPYNVPLFVWTTPRYLADHIKPAIEVTSRHRLRSANRHRLIVSRCRLNTYGRRTFSVAGPTVWNLLPDEFRDPACDIDSFKQFVKTILFSQY